MSGTTLASAVRLAGIAPALKPAWTRAANACPYATYFHAPYWIETVARHHPWGRADNVTCQLTFDDGVTAIVPLLRVRRYAGLLTNHFSSAAGTYGGWISETELGPGHRAAAQRWLCSRPNLLWRENPYDTGMGQVDSRGAQEDFSQVIDLGQGIDAIYAATTYAHKKALRKAEREGITVGVASNPSDWDRYYTLYESSVDRWRKGGPRKEPRSIYSRELIRAFGELQSGHEKLWIAHLRGEPVAGIIVFYWNNHVVTWHGAARSEYFPLRPNNLLYWRILEDAVERGFRWFDFNPSGGYSSVVDFKDQFGPSRARCRCITTTSFLHQIAAACRSLGVKQRS